MDQRRVLDGTDDKNVSQVCHKILEQYFSCFEIQRFSNPKHCLSNAPLSIYLSIYLSISVCMCVCVCLYMYICEYTYVCVRVCAHVGYEYLLFWLLISIIDFID